MDGCEKHGGGRAVGQQGADHFIIDRGGEGGIGKAGFQREGPLFQPVTQRQVQRPAHLRPLRGMDMQVRKTGRQHL